LGDPELQIAYFVEDRDEFVSSAGVPVAVGDDGFRVERDGATIAVIHHSPSLAQVDVVAAAAGAAAPELQAARLRAEISLQLVEVEESRARIVAAATAERKRIERNLHDGAQQRLVALAIQLRLAQRTLESEDAKLVVGAAADEIQGANQDLRELAHGLHPTILTDAGLRRALEKLGERAPFPVEVSALDDRLNPDVELAAYFITAEAIANAVKHAEASSMTVGVSLDGHDLVLVVADDGRGGADPTSSGLLGLADRAAALKGAVTIDSPIGGGTRIVARIPSGTVA
jgi:signal transduction histidine kinase